MTLSPVPEPDAGALLMAGLGALAFLSRRRRLSA
ncbi:PEP-CTERM sorting domain-containing protein [Acinetobacter baumannii]